MNNISRTVVTDDLRQNEKLVFKQQSRCKPQYDTILKI